ncbi:MAG: hypothetical protein LC687_03780, partial [Actinobacteria bacterium]|nr:hypothetical protein [Actinomycetota bacterium]
MLCLHVLEVNFCEQADTPAPQEIDRQAGTSYGDTVRKEIKAYRQNLGLRLSPDSDDIWVDRITSAGSHTIQDAKDALDKAAPARLREQQERQQGVSYNETTSAPSTPAPQEIDRQTNTSYTSKEEAIRREVAAHRKSVGLSPSPKSDQIWVDRIYSGSHTMADAKSRLNQAAPAPARIGRTSGGAIGSS